MSPPRHNLGMSNDERTVGTQRRFEIIYRDDFTCLFCGAKPGNEKLHVDHLLPWSLGGSDHDLNLATACARCNSGKNARIMIPRSLCVSMEVDSDGYATWKRWGAWCLKFVPGGANMAVEREGKWRSSYWFDIDRAHEPDWVSHWNGKLWEAPRTASEMWGTPADHAALDAVQEQIKVQLGGKPGTGYLADGEIDIGVDPDSPLSRRLDHMIDRARRAAVADSTWEKADADRVDFMEALGFARAIRRPRSTG